MFAITFYNLHMEGGMSFMIPLTLLFVANIGIFIYILLSMFQKKSFNPIWLEAIKQIGGLAAAWGTWSTLIGLLYAFDAIEGSPEVIPFPVICGGMKVALLTVLYGLFIFCVSLLAYIILKLIKRNSPA